MGKQDDISATEKLLEVIRKDEKTAGPSDRFLEMETLPPMQAPSVADAGEPLSASAVAAPPLFYTPGNDAATDQGQLRFFEKMPRSATIKKLQPRTSITLGVDIQPSFLSCVKVSAAGDRLQVEDFRYLPLDGEKLPADPGGFVTFLKTDVFRQILKKELVSFCPEPGQCDIWCSLPREFVEVFHLAIPPVPATELANAIFWATKKQTTFDEDNTILDFFLPEGEHTATKKTAIVFLAPQQIVFALRDIFADLGFRLTGITTPSIGFQNQIHLGGVKVPDSFALLHIEEQSSFIDLFHAGKWIFGREIKTGLKSFLDSIVEQAESRGATIDDRAAKKIFFGEEVLPVVTPNSDGVMLPGVDAGPVDDIGLPAAERLVRQLERTFDYCVTTFGTPRATSIYISGQPAASPLLVNNIRVESGLDCAPTDPFKASLKMLHGIVLPTSLTQRCVMNTAFGLALARKLETQNFLDTCQERINFIRAIKTNKIIGVACAALTVFICVLFAVQSYGINKRAGQLRTLEKQLAAATITPDGKIDSARLFQIAQEIQAGRAARAALVPKYFQAGLIGEITRLLPNRVKLVRLSIEPVAGDRRQATENDNKRAVLEGVVSGEEQSREFVMTGFLQQLASSPLVRDASFVQKQIATAGGKKVLHFTAGITPEPMAKPSAVTPQARNNP